MERRGVVCQWGCVAKARFALTPVISSRLDDIMNDKYLRQEMNKKKHTYSPDVATVIWGHVESEILIS